MYNQAQEKQKRNTVKSKCTFYVLYACIVVIIYVYVLYSICIIDL